jgi:hypothetical protein
MLVNPAYKRLATFLNNDFEDDRWKVAAATNAYKAIGAFLLTACRLHWFFSFYYFCVGFMTFVLLFSFGNMMFLNKDFEDDQWKDAAATIGGKMRLRRT